RGDSGAEVSSAGSGRGTARHVNHADRLPGTAGAHARRMGTARITEPADEEMAAAGIAATAGDGHVDDGVVVRDARTLHGRNGTEYSSRGPEPGAGLGRCGRQGRAVEGPGGEVVRE